MGQDGRFRTKTSPSDPKKTAECLKLWEEAVERFHDPEGGIEIVIGPVTAYSASKELLQGAAELRKKYKLCGHTHLLETRGQALQARQWFESGSAVKQLRDTGFLEGRGTALAHSIWLDDDEQKICAEAGAVLVHNPLSNLRLGSGVAPLIDYAAKGIAVAIGVDGSCSSDGQDFLEALKMASFLPRVTTPEYRDWPSARDMALENACKDGYRAIGMDGLGGELQEGMVADVSLWDLSSLALLPRTDPVNLLVMGSRTQAPGAGSTLAEMWVRGVRVVHEGSPCGVDLTKLRAVLAESQREYRDPGMTDPRVCAETSAFEAEYRAALQLDGTTSGEGQAFPADRVLYCPTLKARPKTAR
jgi:cytosine/adenosine deaminase-related metal-dependent hydrolase